MENARLVNILRIINTNGIGPVSFYAWLKKYDNYEKILQKLAQIKEVPPIEWAEEEIKKAEKAGVKIISFEDSIYPQTLKELNDAPPILYLKGNCNLLEYYPIIAIVGARNASIAGRKTASRIAYDLTNSDVLVVSGMARGIDAAAHKGALYAKNQQGTTIAVLGTGVDEVYPEENQNLYQNISENGLLISEFPMGTKAQASNFPRRNRIISAIAQGILVVEAGLHSGSLITARLALEQGKEIFAVPGSPLESRSIGPNSLIKDGAILTESAEDIINCLHITGQQQIKKAHSNSLSLDKPKNNVNIPAHEKDTEQDTVCEQKKLLDLIDYNGVDIDELLLSSQLSQAEFFTQLLELEMSGKVERQVGNKVAKLK